MPQPTPCPSCCCACRCLRLPPPTPTPAAHSSFLFSSDRILAALGTSLLSRSEALAPLCTSLDELSVSASVGHGRLVLLQAAARLFVGLWQRPGAREEMLQLDISQELLSCCLQVRVGGVVGAGCLWKPLHPCTGARSRSGWRCHTGPGASPLPALITHLAH